jgi:hypothetical protein
MLADCRAEMYQPQKIKLLSVCLSLEIPHILWNLEVYYSIHKSLPLVPVMSQNSSITFLQIHFNTTLPFMLSPSKWPTFTWISLHNPQCNPLISHTCPAYLILLDLITRITQSSGKGHQTQLLTEKTTLLSLMWQLPVPSLSLN